MTTVELWVFGYGSLIWRPDLPFSERRVGHVEGWTRRFWQSSSDHRGVPEAPGRVVTLVREPAARCLGVAYRVEESARADVLRRLDVREKNGYTRHQLPVRCTSAADVEALVYVASPDNHAYVGPAPLRSIAEVIARSHGPSGSNVEYLFELETALEGLNAEDSHVFELAQAVRAHLAAG